jgi:hypothetical protein
MKHRFIVRPIAPFLPDDRALFRIEVKLNNHRLKAGGFIQGRLKVEQCD